MREEHGPKEPQGEDLHQDEGVNEQSSTELVSGVIGDARHLIAAEIESLKLEIKSELKRAKAALAAAAVGGGVLALGGLLLVLMIAQGLYAGTTLPLWAAYGIVGGVLAVVGIALLLIGRSQIADKDADGWPEESIEEIKQDVKWVKDQARSRSR